MQIGVIVRNWRWLLLVVSVALLSSISGCALYNMECFYKDTDKATGASILISSADSVTLAWDAPESGAAKYIVSCRVHGQNDWQELGETVSTEYTIQYAVLGDGEFDFAIIAESDVGVRSVVHVSLDTTADPTTGWYLRWQKK
jgi:hypothetical protein